VEVAAAA
jgi:hypothetical protein